MLFSKRNFSGKRTPFPPLPAGHFFCPKCATVRPAAERASHASVICKRCVAGSQAKSRENRRAKGLARR